jgi:hypothetical protein
MTINNNNVFVSAMAGALTGMGIAGRPITSTDPASYSGKALTAFAFAQEFDSLWGSTVPNSYYIPAIQLGCQGYWIGRDTERVDPASFSAACGAIIAAIDEGEIQLAANSVTPSPYPYSVIPARGYGVSGALTLNAGAQAAASLTITPLVSGKIKLRGTGLVRNTDSSPTLHPVIVSYTDSLGNTLQTADTIQCTEVTGAGHNTQTVAFNVDSDHATTTPVTYALGVPVTLHMNLTGDASGDLSIVAGGIQFEVEEALG